MTRIVGAIILIGLAAGMPFNKGSVAADERKFASLAELLPALRSGGFVIYLRHAETDHEQADRTALTVSDCNTQRNLSETGRRQAADLGEAIKTLGIPIGQVISSPFCRCLDTARLAFGAAEPRGFLFYATMVDQERRTAMTHDLRATLAKVPREGTNTVIVSHTANIKEAAGVWPKREGSAFIIRPDGEGAFEITGHVGPEEWPRLAAGSRR